MNCAHPFTAVTALVVMNGSVTVAVTYTCTRCGASDLQLKGLEIAPLDVPELDKTITITTEQANRIAEILG